LDSGCGALCAERSDGDSGRSTFIDIFLDRRRVLSDEHAELSVEIDSNDALFNALNLRQAGAIKNPHYATATDEGAAESLQGGARGAVCIERERDCSKQAADAAADSVNNINPSVN